MKKTVRSIITLLAVATLALPTVASAQEDEDPVRRSDAGSTRRRTLAERIPAVSRRAFQKEGRIEVTPQIGLSLNDPFVRNITGGAGLTFHFLESLAIGASGEVYIGSDTPVGVTGGGNPSVPDYNRAQYAARLDLTWAPLYGKLSLLAEKILHFDTYISIGAGVIGPSKTSPTFAGSVAIGQHYVMSEWLAVKIEVRDQIFSLARNPAADKEKVLQNLLTASVGLCFYLPTEVERPTL